MKELDDFTVERLERIAERRSGIMPTMREIAALARIALAAKAIQPLRVEIQMDDANLMRRFEEMTKWRSPAEPILPVFELNSPEIPDGWIKCSERMPKVGDVVLTAYQGATNIGEMERSGRDYRYFTSIASGRELPADFWMPLPAPPTTEK